MKEEIKNEQFQSVRDWAIKRGINSASFQRQFQRVLQEVVEIHDAYNNEDLAEISDAIGDTIVTLINLATTVNKRAEYCLDSAFNVIKLRKGLNIDGDFVRYAKLSKEEQDICDVKQGNPCKQYFLESDLDKLTKENFIK